MAILVIDDEGGLRRSVCAYLEDLDYDTLEALLRDAQEKGLPDRRVAETLGLPRRTVTYHRLRLGLVPSDRAGTARPGARGPHES